MSWTISQLELKHPFQSVHMIQSRKPYIFRFPSTNSTQQSNGRERPRLHTQGNTSSLRPVCPSATLSLGPNCGLVVLFYKVEWFYLMGHWHCRLHSSKDKMTSAHHRAPRNHSANLRNKKHSWLIKWAQMGRQAS